MPIPTRLQDLPAPQAHFCLNVERFVRSQVGDKLNAGTLLCALSAGVDSTVLCMSLALLRSRLGCEICAAHLDHGLRNESQTEAKAAESLCQRLNIPFVSQRQDVAAMAQAQGIGLEEAARSARYSFLDKARQELGADILAVGHQLDDLAEDVLMRLLRGAGWPQLGGMRAWDPARSLLRPLLLTPRADIEAFATELGLTWCEDASNTDPAFLRNRVRADILPRFVQENPAFLQGVAALWTSSGLDRDYFEALVSEHAPQGQHFLSRDMLAGCHPALRLRLYKAMLEDLGPGQPLADNLHNLERAFAQEQWGKIIQFPGNKKARIGTKGIEFLSSPKNAE